MNGAERPSLAEVIVYLDGTADQTWWPGPTFRSPDGTQHCVLSHIAERWGADALDWFENRWSTSYVIGAVNDGGNPLYPQETPKARSLAYLRALADGTELDTPTSMDTQWMLGFAARSGYLSPKLLGADRYAAVMPLMFTAAIVVGEVGNEQEYADRWCYETWTAAVLALNVWNGDGDPAGWHRHPRTGRRVARTGDEVADDGSRPKLGEVYVAW